MAAESFSSIVDNSKTIFIIYTDNSPCFVIDDLQNFMEKEEGNFNLLSNEDKNGMNFYDFFSSKSRIQILTIDPSKKVYVYRKNIIKNLGRLYKFLQISKWISNQNYEEILNFSYEDFKYKSHIIIDK